MNDGAFDPGGLEPKALVGEYSWEWGELRKLQRRLLKIIVAGAAIIGLFPIANLIPRFGWLIFVGWVAVLFMFFRAASEYSYWSCPRCGKPFHYVAKGLGNWNNPFAGKCVHCGLPKWVDSDPDPKRKEELDPFRTDSIFKLGDIEKRK
jgi:hypothetical protein